MILTCPACATSYFVPDDAIGPSGRRVRCKSCGNDWRAVNEDAPLVLDEGVAVAASPGFGPASAGESATEDDITEQPLTQAFRARAEQKRKAQQAIRQGLAWGVLAIVFITALLSAYIWRDSIVERAPKLASVYSLFGIATNPVGLDFEAQTTGFARNDVSQIYVAGALRNLRDREIVPPPIRIDLFDQSGAQYNHHILRLETAPVLPGGVQGFAVILPNTDGRFAFARYSFVLGEDEKPTARAAAPARAPAKSEDQPVPAKAAVATAKSAQAPKPTAAPEAAAPKGQAMSALGADGLRRIELVDSDPRNG
ncbi:MJ0042-type zinc finger domain-containing protein [uncultured Brevundimonas sp.]|uniref:MJ0042-type zinc finger domain-containing protein n=1 Tax=uncultured Brevundimonas sp. TaxID=213418 RepID=UPI0026169EB1|nr:MJ0042-type zinc finger domain-containing protein [uncultured Brevundimonas sp.]